MTVMALPPQTLRTRPRPPRGCTWYLCAAGDAAALVIVTRVQVACARLPVVFPPPEAAAAAAAAAADAPVQPTPSAVVYGAPLEEVRPLGDVATPAVPMLTTAAAYANTTFHSVRIADDRAAVGTAALSAAVCAAKGRS